MEVPLLFVMVVSLHVTAPLTDVLVLAPMHGGPRIAVPS